MEDTPVLVVKKNGAREPYDIAKLSDRIMRACAKRPVSLEQAEEIATDICAEFKNLMLREVPSELIGEKTLKRLKQLDIVAYIRFASVYGEFENADEFVKVISEI
jgi:transcriptional repressor NrdR